MPEIDIRPAIATDIKILVAIDHNYSTDYVWQMEIQAEEEKIGVNFREIRLPRSVRVEYPRPVRGEGWRHGEKKKLKRTKERKSRGQKKLERTKETKSGRQKKQSRENKKNTRGQKQ